MQAPKNIKLFDLEREAGCPICLSVAQVSCGDPPVMRTACGWGETRQTARARCISESKERLAAVWFDDISFRRMPYIELPPEAALNPSDLILLSCAQYQERGQWNASVQPAFRHPAPFDPKVQVEWVEGQSLATGVPVLVPAACVYLGYPRWLETGFTVPDSNGLAAGADREDALQRALFEVAERDAVSIWWYNKLRRPGVDPDSTMLSHSVSAWLQQQGRTLALLDLTHDFHVPVVTAVSCDEFGADISIGFAAAASMEAAIDGALGEMAQFDFTKRMARSNDGIGHSSPFLFGLAQLSKENAPFLFPSEQKRQEQQSVISFDRLVASFKELAPDTAVFEFPEVDSTAIRVIAPGLRPIWPRFAPGRLYSVPVTLGWREAARQEASLNRRPILY